MLNVLEVLETTRRTLLRVLEPVEAVLRVQVDGGDALYDGAPGDNALCVVGAGGRALYASLYAGVRRWGALFARGVEINAPCAAP